MWNVCAYAWRALVHDVRRHLTAGFSLVIGVMLLTATIVVGGAATASVRDGIDALGGVGDVGIVPDVGSPPLDPSTVELVATLPGVTLVVPTHSANASVVHTGTPADDAMDLTITGLPRDLGDRVQGLLVVGQWPHRQGEVVVPDSVADDLDVEVGDRLTVGSSRGPAALRVVGIADAERLGLFADGNVFVSIDAAWRLSGVSGEYTRIELAIDPSARSAFASAASASLPDGVSVQQTDAVTDALGPVATAVTAMVIATGFLVLVLACILAATTGADLAHRRRSTTAVLAAVGARARWVRATVMAESVMACTIAAVLGTAAGIALGVTVARAVGSPAPVPTLVLVATAGPVLGALTGTIASFTGGRRETATVTDGRRPVWSVVTVFGLTAAMLVVAWARPTTAATLAGIAAMLVAAATASSLLRPVIVRLSRRWHWTARGLHPTAGNGIAAVAAVVVVSGIALASAAANTSAATTAQITAQFGADVQATATTPLPRDALRAARRLPGVGAIATSSVDTVSIRSDHGALEAPVLAVAPGWFSVEDLAWRADRTDGARRRIEHGDGVAVPAALATRSGLQVGDTVTISLRGATARAPVVGTFTSLATGDQIVIGHRTARQLSVAAPTGWDIDATPGADPVAVRDRVAALLSPIPGVSVITAADMRARAVQQLVVAFAGVFALVGIAAVLGAIGTAGGYRRVVERRRSEFAVLRAVGARAVDVRRIVAWEWAVSLASGLVPGALAGVLTGVLATRLVEQTLGVALDGDVPVLAVGAVGLCVAVTTAVACRAPARSAARTSPAIALREDPS